MTRVRYFAFLAALLGVVGCQDKASGAAATADSAAATDTQVASDGGAGDAATADTQGQGGDAKADTTAADTTTADTATADTTAATDSALADASAADAAQDVATVDAAAAEVAPGNPCVAAGGTVESQTCCKATADFPNLCAIGACGCSPDNSKATQVCKCPDGKCFDGKDCVKQ